jgi:hypothetical protein
MSVKTPADPAAKPRPLIHTAFRTTKEQVAALQKEADRRGVERSALIRGVLETFLKEAR